MAQAKESFLCFLGNRWSLSQLLYWRQCILRTRMVRFLHRWRNGCPQIRPFRTCWIWRMPRWRSLHGFWLRTSSRAWWWMARLRWDKKNLQGLQLCCRTVDALLHWWKRGILNAMVLILPGWRPERTCRFARWYRWELRRALWNARNCSNLMMTT